jgi:hypothetical protein
MNVRKDMSAMKKLPIVLAAAALLVVGAAGVIAAGCGGSESQEQAAALGEISDGLDPIAPNGSPDPMDPMDEPLHEDGDLYDVTVLFNTSVTQEDIDAVEATLRAHDADLEFVLMESFPPIGSAVMAREGADFCANVEGELVAESYIDEVSCEPRQPPVGDLDEPVEHRNDEPE